MFETDIGREKSNEVVSRKWALIGFGAWALIGLVGGIAFYLRWRLAAPWYLADMAAIFAFSLYWFVDALRHGPPRQKALTLRILALILLGNAPTWLRMFRM
jgi:hypothetical protein